MGDSDSFISEVSDEVRRDRLYGVLRRYGWLIGAAIALIVSVAAFNEWRKAASRAEAEAAGEALHAAYAEADPSVRAARIAEVAETLPPEGQAIARIAQAGSLLAADARTGASEVLGDIASDGSAPELLRSLASLQRAMMLGDAMDASERAATLATLAAEGAPFRPLALEQQALMHLESGETDAALAALQATISAPDAPEGLVARARQMIIAAGGALPDAGGVAVPLPPADG